MTKLCFNCLGCNRLENKDFNGVNKCNYFDPKKELYQILLDLGKEYKNDKN